MTAAGENPKADSQFLDHVKDGHERQLKGEELISPLDTALPGGDDAADIGIGQHDHEARSEYRQGSGPPARFYSRVESTGRPMIRV
jgi:hypothetical protein